MILKSIHIESFGGLNRFDADFSSGSNVIVGDNGTGKSSLSMFVKFIFYGLSSRAGRSGVSERQRWLNRGAGEASGWLIAETDDGTTYRIERAIRPTDGGALRERIAVSNQETGEVVSGQNPGELFFGVPEEVFLDTCFVAQAGVRPTLAVGASAAGSKGAVENLLTSADESVDIRRALMRLDALRRELKHKTGGGGEIPALKEKRAALAAERKSAAEKSAELLSLSASLDDINRRIGELEEDRERFAAVFDSLDKINQKRRSDAAASDAAQLNRINAALAQMDGSPFGEGFDDLLEDAEREIRAFDEQEAAFRERFPDEGDHPRFPDEPRPYPFRGDEKSGETEDDELPDDGPIPKSAFSRGDDVLPPDGIDPYEDTGAIEIANAVTPPPADETLPDAQEAVDEVKHLAAQAKGGRIAGIVLALCAVLGLAVALIQYRNNSSAYLLTLAATLIVMTAAVISLIRCVATVSKLNALLSEWNAESPAEIEVAVQERLAVIERDRAEESEKRRLSAKLDAARLGFDAALTRVNDLLAQAGIESAGDVFEDIRTLRRRGNEVSGDRRQLAERRGQLEGRLEILREQLADANADEIEADASRALLTDEGRRAAALTPEEIKDLVRQRDFTLSALASAEKRRAALEEKLASVGKISRPPDELDTLIEAADRRITELELRRDALALASEAIGNAGEEMRRDVIPRVAERASDRVKRASGSYDRLLLDSGLSCTLAEDTALTPQEILSRGEADLAYLSLRLALTDEMFRTEKPPVFLDESFAHIDLDRAARFLATLTDRQSLIFTCRRDEAEEARRLGCRVTTLSKPIQNGGTV